MPHFFVYRSRKRSHQARKRIFVERSTLDSIPLLYLHGEDVVFYADFYCGRAVGPNHEGSH